MECWYALDEDVHHCSPQCDRGLMAMARSAKPGTGDRPLCPNCAEILKRQRDSERRAAALTRRWRRRHGGGDSSSDD